MRIAELLAAVPLVAGHAAVLAIVSVLAKVAPHSAPAAAALSNFSRPCPPPACSEVEVNALLQYVANQLKSSESLDLLLLKEMVQTMTVRRGRGRAGKQLCTHLPDGLAARGRLAGVISTLLPCLWCNAGPPGGV